MIALILSNQHASSKKCYYYMFIFLSNVNFILKFIWFSRHFSLTLLVLYVVQCNFLFINFVYFFLYIIFNSVETDNLKILFIILCNDFFKDLLLQIYIIRIDHMIFLIWDFIQNIKLNQIFFNFCIFFFTITPINIYIFLVRDSCILFLLFLFILSACTL